MDKIKLTRKEFDELYSIDEEPKIDEPTTLGDNIPEEEFLTAEELAQDKELEELL